MVGIEWKITGLLAAFRSERAAVGWSEIGRAGLGRVEGLMKHEMIGIPPNQNYETGYVGTRHRHPCKRYPFAFQAGQTGYVRDPPNEFAICNDQATENSPSTCG